MRDEFHAKLIVVFLSVFIIAGCGSSKSSTDKSTSGNSSIVENTERNPVDSIASDTSRAGSADSNPPSIPNLYARGQVITPAGSTGVALAGIEVKAGGRNGRLIASTLADSTGRFRVRKPLKCDQCWFVAKDSRRDIEGSVKVEVPGERMTNIIYITLGREGLEITPFDTTEADPGGAWGKSRTGGR